MLRRLVTSMLVLFVGHSLLAVEVTAIKSTETGIRNDATWSESTMAYLSPGVARLEVTKAGETEPYMVVIYKAEASAAQVVDFEHQQAMMITPQLLDSLQAEIPEGLRAPTSQTNVKPTDVTDSFNDVACSIYRLDRASTPTRYFCLANPTDIPLGESVVKTLREVTELFMGFGRVSSVLTAINAHQEPKPDSTFNPYGLSAGYPVRAWQIEDGRMTWEARVDQVTTVDIPAAALEFFDTSE